MKEGNKKNIKKKIAFILGQMNQGGPARNFININHFIDKSKYDITLILLKRGGGLFNEIPDDITIKLIDPQGLFDKALFSNNILKKYYWIIVNLLIRVLAKLFKVAFSAPENINWVLNELFIRKEKVKYDMAMSLVEGTSNYYLAKFIKAKVKVGRVPTDYKVAKLPASFDAKYFTKLDYIATNSQINYNSLCDVFPELQEKFIVVNTIILPDVIRKMADKGKSFEDSYDGIRILTLSRLDDTKGTDIAIKACNILIKKFKFELKWYILGNGSREKYLKIIDDYGLIENFVLLDPVPNPYSYIKNSDIYVQPSTYEGNSNAVNEAKALNKPIVLTNFNTAGEHLVNMEEGVIAKGIDENSLANAIKLLIQQPQLRDKLSANLKASFKGNSNEFDKILNLIN